MMVDGYEVLTAAITKSAIFCDMTTCIPVKFLDTLEERSIFRQATRRSDQKS
jgi:hypothetical protein